MFRFLFSYSIEDVHQPSTGESVIVYYIYTYMKKKIKNVYTLKYASILMPLVYSNNREVKARETAPPSA